MTMCVAGNQCGVVRRSRQLRAAVFPLLSVLAGFAPTPSQCPLPSQKPMVIVELFFGRDISGRHELTEREWSHFVADVAARQFADGFTVTDGVGEWRDPAMRKVIRERTKIITAALPMVSDAAGKIARVAEAYRARFHQKSVGVITRTECAAF